MKRIVTTSLENAAPRDEAPSTHAITKRQTLRQERPSSPRGDSLRTIQAIGRILMSATLGASVCDSDAERNLRDVREARGRETSR